MLQWQWRLSTREQSSALCSQALSDPVVCRSLHRKWSETTEIWHRSMLLVTTSGRRNPWASGTPRTPAAVP
jgi:hypothetical protein